MNKMIQPKIALRLGGYKIFTATPAVGILYEVNGFLSGNVRLRGRDNGSYLYNYLEMLDYHFGPEYNTIEVGSGNIRELYGGLGPAQKCTTVDINPDCKPDIVADGQYLSEIRDNSFKRWRCDPPYNDKTSKGMYKTEFPNFNKLLKTGARVIEPNSLMFLLCSQNYQMCPSNVTRIGFIYISVVPNNETRILNIYVKTRN